MPVDLIGLIFCSGKGTRLYPITYTIPKPLIKITDDLTFLDLNINFLIEQGIKKIFINYSYGKELFDQVLKRYPTIRFHLIYESEPLGHGNTLINAARIQSLEGENFNILALNGDTLIASISTDFSIERLSSNIGINVYGSKPINILPNNLFVSNSAIIGVQGKTKEYFYLESHSAEFEKNNTLGIYLVSNLVANLTLRNENEFIGLFGEDDLLEKLTKSNLKCMYIETIVTGYSSVNTEVELNNLREFLSSDL